MFNKKKNQNLFKKKNLNASRPSGLFKDYDSSFKNLDASKPSK